MCNVHRILIDTFYVILCIRMAFTGLDYASGDTYDRWVNEALSPGMVPIGFVCVGISIASLVVIRRYEYARIASIVSAAVYSAFAWLVFRELAYVDGSFSIPKDDFRLITDHIASVFLWLTLSLCMTIMKDIGDNKDERV